MAFSTPIFVYGFLPVMLAVYYLLPRPARNGWLVAGSYLFYGLGNPSCVLVLLFCTTCTFSLALFMPRRGTRTRQLLLLFSILASLGPLVFFRYSGFLTRATRELTGIPGAETLSWLGTVVIPLGISFYTLQALSYSIDVYRGETKPATRLVDFAVFMAFF
ncbi:MAG: MBOAT family protein, partial [Verrucomicrobiota bacterium]|nr:MBOAT family protein [Verrucomicrobiota bacterium]